MNTQLKAIETRYKGYKFRSRLEARWATFFDALGVAYEYEKEGYDLPSGWYLPDFWLPEAQVWVEIKPETPTWNEGLKLEELAELSGQLVLLIGGQPWPDEYYIGSWTSKLAFDDLRYHEGSLFVCSDCAGWAVLNAGGGHFYHDSDQCKAKCNLCSWKSMRSARNSPRLMYAFQTARSARFEHGEAPKGRY